MSIEVLGCASLALLLFVSPALAHHSFAMFDQSKVVYLSGKVKQFEWVNPHAWLHLTVTSAMVKSFVPTAAAGMGPALSLIPSDLCAALVLKAL